MKFLLVKVVGPDAVAWSCSLKKVFLKNLQNSQEKTCARVSFLIKLLCRSTYWFLYDGNISR